MWWIVIVIKLSNLEIGYNQKAVVGNLNWSFPQNEISIIKGPNGSGKTTLLKTIGGINQPLKGEVEFCSNEVVTGSSYLPQMGKTNLDFPIRVFQFVSMGLLNKSIFFKMNSKKVFEILDSLDLIIHRDKYINELSGGLYQRCLFARMILEESPILLLDEPFNFLDEENKNYLGQLVKKLSRNKTILMVLHDLEDIAYFKTNVYDLKEHKAK
jgi:ABC-type Mn2+/Zn2+ transport system ATPase subunit